MSVWLRCCCSLMFFFAVLSCQPMKANAASVFQASFNKRTESYILGYDSITEIPILKAPPDADWKRVAMLHDGSSYRLYVFKIGSTDTMYQFGYNPQKRAYIFGYQSIDILKIVRAPKDIDATSFAMSHDGTTFRLYLGKKGSDNTLYQFAYHTKKEAYIFGYQSEEQIFINDMPLDVKKRKVAMLHDGSHYRYYALNTDKSTLYQAAWNGSVYEYGHQSIPAVPITSKQPLSGDIAMLHDGEAYRLYFIVP